MNYFRKNIFYFFFEVRPQTWISINFCQTKYFNNINLIYAFKSIFEARRKSFKKLDQFKKF